MTNEAKTPAERVRFILGNGEEDGADQGIDLGGHQLFIQMDILAHFDDGRMGWKEQARWLKYEETVETGERWSKPHVPTPTMHGFLELRKGLVTPNGYGGGCAVSLDYNVSPSGGVHTVSEPLMDTIRKNWNFSDDILAKIEHVVLEPHKHLHRHSDGKKNHSGIPVSNTQTTLSISSAGDDDGLHKYSEESGKNKHKRFQKREGSGKDLVKAYYSYPEGCNPDNLKPYKPNKKLSKKLPAGCESANILVGQLDCIMETVMVLCRLKSQSTMADLTEVDIPTRFVFFVLGGTSSTTIWELAEIGRSTAVLLNDKIFREVAYRARSKEDLIDGLDEFLDDVLVLPPSVWDPATRLAPPKDSISMEKIRNRLEDSTRHPTGADDSGASHEHEDDAALVRTGRIFGGLLDDMKRRYPRYLTDIKDGLNAQCLASIVFLFFACISPIVTFGGLMGQKTDGYMGTIEMLMAGFICGIIYALFSGQPLTIIGATGPLLVFESIVYQITKEYEYDFLSFRLWIGVWVTVILVVIVAFDLSAYVSYITRFTEECFSILISIIFIYEAFTKVLHIWDHQAVQVGTVRVNASLATCHCEPSHSYTTINNTEVYRTLAVNWTEEFEENCITLKERVIVKPGCISETACVEQGWNLTGPSCYNPTITSAVPDVFLLSVMLFFTTFSVAMFFRNMRTSRFFPTIVRSTLADFAVLLSIVCCTSLDIAFGIDTPKLNVPGGMKTTRSDRSWLINPLEITRWWLIPLALVPALLATILIFLDQQISAVIVNRKEHKLKKGHGYHLDLLVLSVLILICSLLGLPWFVAATVRSISHVKSLFYYSQTSMPGESPQMLGCREQRVTGVFIHLLIGLATLATPLLSKIPMPVLYGVFLYMGVTSLGGVQFYERVLILLMPAKYQPDYIYLRHVKTTRVHIFTTIQIVCMIAMWVIKTVKITAIAFPVLLIALIGVRKALDYVFTQSDLFWLDHLLPDAHRREKEDMNKVHDHIAVGDKSQMRNIVPRRSSAAYDTAIVISEKVL